MSCNCSNCEYKEELQTLKLLFAHLDEQIEASNEELEREFEKLENDPEAA